MRQLTLTIQGMVVPQAQPQEQEENRDEKKMITHSVHSDKTQLQSFIIIGNGSVDLNQRFQNLMVETQQRSFSIGS